MSTDIPNIELHVLVCNCLDVESHCRNSRDILIKLQLIQYRRLASSIESQHQQAHFLGPEDLAHHLGDLSSHIGGGAGRLAACRVRARVGQLEESFVSSCAVLDAIQVVAAAGVGLGKVLGG